MAPCAVLCLMPFEHRFRAGGRRAWARAAAIIAAGLVVFLAVVASPFVVPGGVPYEVYNPLQNVVFLATVAALFVLYLREVEAPAAHKAFVFSLVVFFAFFAALTSSNVSYLMDLSEQSDGYMYYPPRLAVMAVVYLVFFCVMTPFMRAVGCAFSSRIESVTWWRMSALPAILVVTLLVGAWLPPIDYEDLYFTMSFAITVDGVILTWWMLRMVRLASEDAEKRAELEHALRKRVAELEHEASSAAAPEEEAEPLERPVVLSTSRRAFSFMPDEVTYVESLNRARTVHFTNGERVEIDMTLSAIVEVLPADRFVYCHRFVVVNLDHVRDLSTEALTLDDGSTIPVSRRRYAKVRDALVARQ